MFVYVYIYILADTFRMAVCTIPCIQCVPVTLLLGVKQLKCEAVHSALPSVEVKNFGTLFPTACLPHSMLGGIYFLCLFLNRGYVCHYHALDWMRWSVFTICSRMLPYN